MKLQIPSVLRARGYRLYLANGKRLIDLWLNGGAAIMGHTPPNLLRELKNTASRGLYAPFPHFTEARFLKALSKLLPGCNFRLYASPPPELVSLFNSGKAKIWRPFTTPDSNSIIIPVLPGISLWRNELPFGLCIACAPETLLQPLFEQLPESDRLPPILLAVAARGVHDILAAPERFAPASAFPRIAKVLKQADNPWHQNGIYLELKNKPSGETAMQLATWDNLFQKFLNAGFLLPPAPAHPLILPGELSVGEETKLAELLK
ncbi:MAG: hypothetical protein FWD26_07115 [Treponema sp.]|nr:hypothetical protein [Treponema sp.]